MKVKRLKELLNRFDDDIEVLIRNSNNICGNISDLDQVEKTTYGFFGTSVDCIVLNTSDSKDMDYDENGDIIDFIEERDN